jgi:hypothetical protein
MGGKYNPFRPDKIVPPGMFCGRMDELKFLDHCLLQTKNGNPQHFLVEGERGIGKSSLLLSEYVVATGRAKTIEGNKTLDFVVVEISLEPDDDYFSIIKKIAQQLAFAIGEREKLKAYAFATIEFISRIEAGGVRVREGKAPQDSELFTNLQKDLVNLIHRLDGSADGILFLIDEADKAPASANLGQFCKLLTEGLSKKGSDRLCIGLAGLPGLIGTLRASHESSPRMFKTIGLKPLERDERAEVIDIGMKEATEKNGREIKITLEAKRLISELSEGYPHFLQEFAYCAFEADSDDVIDREDVTSSLFSENGAFDQLGRKYFDQYYAAPDSDDYRTMLDCMAKHSDDWVTRTEIIKESKLKAGTVDNGLRALKKANIIIANDMKSGQYRLPTKSFAAWIKVAKRADAPLLLKTEKEG